MSGRTVEVPDMVRKKATALGADGLRWLNRLDETIDQLERDWGVVVGSTYHGGSEAYVAAAKTSDGAQAVIKIAIPGHALSDEARTLALANGHGYARLLEHDDAHQAMLLERLGSPLTASGLPIEMQIEILCVTLQRAWEVPAEPSLPSGADKARRLSTFIAATWEELNRPCSERIVEQAQSFAGVRGAAFDADTAVLAHGDAGCSNALQASDGSEFKLVDPDGLFAERAYDLAISMRDWSGSLLKGDPLKLGRDRCDLLGRLTGVDTQAIWEWGFIERVSTGLLALQVSAEQMGREMLDVADHWVER
jgi:streptomycin 6-kinase